MKPSRCTPPNTMKPKPMHPSSWRAFQRNPTKQSEASWLGGSQRYKRKLANYLPS